MQRLRSFLKTSKSADHFLPLRFWRVNLNPDAWEIIELYGPDSQIQQKHLNRNGAKEALTIPRLMLVLLMLKL